jgi:uncharacterized membrane protein
LKNRHNWLFLIIEIFNGGVIMSGKVKQTINTILAAVGLAMGVAVIVITIVDTDIATIEIIRLLAVSAVSFGMFAINNISREGAENDGN